MMKVQSFPWAVKPISKSERESKVVKRTTDSIALEVETGLQAISAEARALLLKPYIEESLSYHRDKLKSELAQDMQDKLEKELQNRVGLAIAPLKENIELEEKNAEIKLKI
ncbi:hypothetical protein [Shewanella woodyi]|uniref:hypothetical protein n=1 Tax=Shewanella woodyi TaxID=60961 RepID=UPI003748D9B5